MTNAPPSQSQPAQSQPADAAATVSGAFTPNSFCGERLACQRGGRLVFKALDFTVEPGQCLILIGANGAGKSSLLRLMAGLMRPAFGRLTWGGQDVHDLPERGRTLHYIGHHDSLKPVLTAWENLDFLARMHGIDPGVAPGRAALDPFDLAPLADTPGRMLSAGQKRRLALSRLIAAPAPLWLLDEPTTALDRASIARLEGIIEAHRAHGGMVVLSTHGDVKLARTQTLNLDEFRAKPEALLAKSDDWGDDEW